jgi:hypothetical protein
MKSMALTYMLDMVQEGIPTLRAQCHLSPRFKSKNVKLTIHCHLVLIL